MHLCYIDESGDDGVPGASDYFALSSVYFPESNWNSLVAEIKQFRSQFTYFPFNFELHTVNLLACKRPYQELHFTQEDRIEIITQFCSFISNLDIRIINVFINKNSRPNDVNSNWVCDNAITFLVQRIYNDLKINNKKDYFMLIVDPGRIGKMRDRCRELKRNNFLVRKQGGWFSRKIETLIEDPLEKPSHESFFIQFSDLVVTISRLYVYYNYGFGSIGSRIRYINLEIVNGWMNILLPILNTDACKKNKYGVFIK